MLTKANLKGIKTQQADQHRVVLYKTAELHELQKTVNKYSEIFKEDLFAILPPKRGTDYIIDIDNALSININAYLLLPVYLEEQSKQIKQMLA